MEAGAHGCYIQLCLPLSRPGAGRELEGWELGGDNSDPGQVRGALWHDQRSQGRQCGPSSSELQFEEVVELSRSQHSLQIEKRKKKKEKKQNHNIQVKSTLLVSNFY